MLFSFGGRLGSRNSGRSTEHGELRVLPLFHEQLDAAYVTSENLGYDAAESCARKSERWAGTFDAKRTCQSTSYRRRVGLARSEIISDLMPICAD